MSQRDAQPMYEMYKRIEDGLNRWMKNVGMSRRDEFREGQGSLRFGWNCIFRTRIWVKTGELVE